MMTPVDFATEIGPGNDITQLKVIGRFAAVIGSLICLLVFLPNPFVGRLGILFVGGFVAAVGLLLVKVGRNAERDQELRS